MKKTGLNYYDLLQSAGLSSDELQSWVDGFFANKYNATNWEGFKFDLTPMMDYTYQQMTAELGVNVMATYVNPDSDVKARSGDGFSVITGTIPTMKTRLERDEKEIRDLMIATKMNPESATEVALAQLYKKVDTLIGAHANSITYQVNQMKSAGELTLLDTNNPGGLVDVTFSAQIPTGNTTTLLTDKRWWTDEAHETEGSASDPIKDLKAAIKKLRYAGVGDITLEIESNTFDDLLYHSKVVTKLGYSVFSNATSDAAALAMGQNLDDDTRAAALGRILKCTVKPVDHKAEVEVWDKDSMSIVKTQLDSFKRDVCVLRPSGDLGVIKHVQPILPPATAPGSTARYFNGSLVLRTWADINTNLEYFNTVQAVLAVIDKPKYVYRIVVR